MTLPRRLSSSVGMAASFTPTNYLCWFGGSTGNLHYSLGRATSSDGGATWTADAGNPLISWGSSWASVWLAQCNMVISSGTYYLYATGYNGTKRVIGLFTSTDGNAWTDRGVVLDVDPTGGAFDHDSVNFPTVLHDSTLSPAWLMWYTGWLGSTTTIGYATSSDGLSWTKAGKVLDVGSAGAFDDSGLAAGAAVPLGGGSYGLYYAGLHSSFYHTGYATTTNPASSGAYTKSGVLTGFSGTLTVAGTSWSSNQITSVLPRGGAVIAYVSLFHPNGSPGKEAMAYTTATAYGDHVAAPSSGIMVPLSGWTSNSAENPTVVPVI